MSVSHTRTRNVRRRRIITGALVSLAVVCVVLAVTLSQDSGSSSSKESSPAVPTEYHVAQGAVNAAAVPFEGAGDVSSFLQCRFAKSSASSYDCETSNPLLYSPDTCILALYRSGETRTSKSGASAVLTCGGPKGKGGSTPDLTSRGTVTVQASKFDSPTGARQFFGDGAVSLAGGLPSEANAPQTWSLIDDQARSFAVTGFKQFALKVDASKSPIKSIRVLSADGSVYELPNVKDEFLVVAGKAPAGSKTAALVGTPRSEVVSATAKGAKSAIFASRSDAGSGFEARLYDDNYKHTHTIRYSAIKSTDARVGGRMGALNVSIEHHTEGRRFWTVVSTERRTGRELSLESSPSGGKRGVVTAFHNGKTSQALIRGTKSGDARGSLVISGEKKVERPQWALDALALFRKTQYAKKTSWPTPTGKSAIKPRGELDDLEQCASGVYSSYENCKDAAGNIEDCVSCGVGVVSTEGAALDDPDVLEGCYTCAVNTYEGSTVGSVEQCVEGLGTIESNCDSAYHDLLGPSCDSFYDCSSCYATTGCHWCGSSCNAYGSIYGCFDGSSCN